MSRKIITLSLILVITSSILFAVSKTANGRLNEFKPPKLKITCDDTELDYTSRLNYHDDNIHDNFIALMEDCLISDLVYIKSGEAINFEFASNPPKSVTLTSYILNTNGTRKYNERVNKQIDIEFHGKKGSFILEDDMAAMLSSNSADYEPGASIRGFRLLCNWGDNECEYSFIIRSDASISFQTLPHKTQMWFDYLFDVNMPWDKQIELNLPEFPDTTFVWTSANLTAINADGEKIIISGMPIWNVYLTDLTDDGLPELCATVSIGSGIIDERIIVYDYAKGNTYELSDRFYYNYTLFIDVNRLMVKQTKSSGFNNRSGEMAVGQLAISNDELIAVGIDRSLPE